MAIPPGPQVPFDKDRPYGQQPGFVSRNLLKFIAFMFIVTVVIVVTFLIVANLIR
ncbi:MAG: hypothetical protein O3B04_04890 [Chloroflexi bacterium]|nr:hypothetical protein [Chloroflexota bacterium]